jgi:hypothetical protein
MRTYHAEMTVKLIEMTQQLNATLLKVIEKTGQLVRAAVRATQE